METYSVEEILSFAGLSPDEFYPGKRLVIPLKQVGEYRSHCVVYDWRHPEKITVEVKAGLSGKNLQPKELAKYPVSLQAKTLIEFDVSKAIKQ